MSNKNVTAIAAAIMATSIGIGGLGALPPNGDRKQRREKLAEKLAEPSAPPVYDVHNAQAELKRAAKSKKSRAQRKGAK